jgi:hypothetical protein
MLEGLLRFVYYYLHRQLQDLLKIALNRKLLKFHYSPIRKIFFPAINIYILKFKIEQKSKQVFVQGVQYFRFEVMS